MISLGKTAKIFNNSWTISLLFLQALEQVLSNGVDALCQTQVGQRAEIAPEMQIIKATVALSLSMIKSCPEVKDKLQNAVGAFLNRRVGPWVAQQGGWVSSFYNQTAIF